MMTVLARADWDPAASVWTVQSSDVPGLVTEHADLEGLRVKLGELAPALLAANLGQRPTEGQVVLRAYRLGMLADLITIQFACQAED